MATLGRPPAAPLLSGTALSLGEETGGTWRGDGRESRNASESGEWVEGEECDALGYKPVEYNVHSRQVVPHCDREQ